MGSRLDGTRCGVCARTIGMRPGQCNVQDECYLLGYHRLADVLRGWRDWWERTNEYADPARIYEATCAALAELARSTSEPAPQNPPPSPTGDTT